MLVVSNCFRRKSAFAVGRRIHCVDYCYCWSVDGVADSCERSPVFAEAVDAVGVCMVRFYNSLRYATHSPDDGQLARTNY